MNPIPSLGQRIGGILDRPLVPILPQPIPSVRHSQKSFMSFPWFGEENKIVWYVDETKFKTFTSADVQGERYPFNQPFFLLFNIAVGGAWQGSPDNTTVFPQSMEIDYVRVFQIQ